MKDIMPFLVMTLSTCAVAMFAVTSSASGGLVCGLYCEGPNLQQDNFDPFNPRDPPGFALWAKNC